MVTCTFLPLTIIFLKIILEQPCGIRQSRYSLNLAHKETKTLGNVMTSEAWLLCSSSRLAAGD